MDGTGSLEHLGNQRYVRLTTFRRNGRPVDTAVWPVVIDGALYVHTGDQTGKAKRLRIDRRAEIAASTARGRVIGETVSMTGTPLNGEETGRLDAAFRAKYGWQYRAVRLSEGLRRKKIGEPTYYRFETR